MVIAFQGRVFSVEVDRVRFPNGREQTIEIVRHGPSVVVVAMPDHEHVMLVRQYRASIGRETWEVPAGGMNRDESAEEAARRECGEEIGLVPRRLSRIRGLFPAPGFCDEELIFFVATELEPAGTQYTPDEDEDILTQSFGVPAARAMVERGEIVDLKTAYGLSLIP